MDIEAACLVSQDIYFINQDYKSLMKIDYKSGKMQFVAVLCQDIGLIRRLIYWKRQIWMFSIQSNTILIYDLFKADWSSLTYPYEAGFGGFCGVLIGNYYYGFSKHMCDIIEINLNSRNVEICRCEITKYCKDEKCMVQEDAVCRNCCLANGKIYAVTGYHFILEYDYKRHCASFCTVGQKGDRFATICFDGKAFWMTDSSQYVTKWNYGTNQITKMCIDIRDFSVQGIIPFRASLYRDGCVWLLSSSANRNVRIYVEKEKIESDYVIEGDRKGRKVQWHSFVEDKILFVDAEKSQLVEEDRDKNIKTHSLILNEELREQLAQNFIKWDLRNSVSGKVYCENCGRICLIDFIKGLAAFNTEKEINISEL